MDSLDGAPVIAMTRQAAVRVKDAAGVAVGKIWRPRRPAKAPLKAVGVKDAKGVAVITGDRVKASGLGAPMVGGGEKGPLEDGIAMCRMDALADTPVITTTRQEAVGVKHARGVAVEKMWRRQQPTKAPLKVVGVKAEVVAVIDGKVESSVLADPVVAATRGWEKGPLEVGTAVCLMDSLDGAPVNTTTRHEAVGVKDAEGVAMGKMWRPRRPAKAPMKAVGVKDAKGVAVITRDGVKASGLGDPLVGGEEKGPLEDGIAMCRMDALAEGPVIATTRQDAVGVKDISGVAVGKMWRRRQMGKAPLKAVGVKDAEGVAVIAVDGKVDSSVLAAPVVAASRCWEKGPLEDGTAVCLMDSLDGAPVNTTTRHEAVGVKDAEGVAMGKMWQSRRPAKAPLKAVGVKDAKGVAVITRDGVKASGLGAPLVGGEEKGPLEDGIAMCRMDALAEGPVIATTRQDAVGVKDISGVAVGKMWRRRQTGKAPLKAVGVKDAEGVAVIAVDGKVDSSVLAVPVVAASRCWEKGPLEDGTAVCLMDSLDGAPVNATTRQEAVGVKEAEGVAVGKVWRPRRPAKALLEMVGVKDAEGGAVIAVEGKVEASVLGALVVTADEGGEKGPLEEGIAVCQMDARAPVLATTRQDVVGVKDAQEIAVITVDGEVEASVLGALVVVLAEGGEKGPLEEGIVVCWVDTLDGAPVTTTTQHETVGVKDTEEVAVGKMWRPRRPAKAPLEAVGVKDAKGVAVITHVGEAEPLVLGVPVVAAGGGEEKGSLEDGIVVCPMDALIGAPVIATDEKEEVSVQGDPVFPAIDQKVDAPVVEGMQASTAKGNGKEEKDKDKEGIKWLKHYSTAQSILIIGDGDFSFSLALATTFGSGGNLVATSLDSYGALTIKYGKAESNVRELKRLGATVLHGVDAKTMKLHSYLEMRRFDRIVFNFPHAGFKGKENQLHVINAHKQLVHGFFTNARELLRPYGEIHLSHKKGLPYDAWGIKKLAYESCLIMVRKVDFSKEDYPGYNQKRGDGPTCDESFPLGPCCTFMFCVGVVEKLKPTYGNRVGSISSCLGDSRFYPGISATDMMWPFDLHPAWPQPHFPLVHMPIAFDPCPFGVAEMEDPFNCYGTSFHHQDMVQPTRQEQPWYQEGPPIEPPWTPQEHQSLQREYEIHRQLTLSREAHYMESVERQAMLEMLSQVYGRQ